MEAPISMPCRFSSSRVASGEGLNYGQGGGLYSVSAPPAGESNSSSPGRGSRGAATGISTSTTSTPSPTPRRVSFTVRLEVDETAERRQVFEEAWRVMQPLVDAPPPVHPYAKGSWGPQEANRLLAGHGRWHEPWMFS